ncbi:MAG: P1 family peptidase [Actinobacteria bacterium]|nr:P1 family peptidase [Actinomycetota bacterium]MBU1942734.1 P1 family peptidase [Actinomycetota bacterium]MBU2686056.1 P1 family peptidase [Actinomycetota bacterium]
MLGTIRVGHAHDELGLTGCTVFLVPPGAVAGVEVRGGAPGTRETDLLKPTCTVEAMNAVLLSGGSAFGINAAEGVMRYLEERGVGFPTPGGIVPIVSAAVIFDLDVGDPGARPDAQMAYRACSQAGFDEDREGSVGVGMGATVGNVLGRPSSTRGGFGMYRFAADGFRIEVAGVVNSFGNVVNDAGRTIAGVRGADGFLDAEKLICVSGGFEQACGQNTTLVVVATNAKLDCSAVQRLAMQGHNGIARAVRPSHTRYDGDTVFAIATGEVEVSPDAVEVLAAMGTAEALRSAVMHAEAAGGIPAACDIH